MPKSSRGGKSGTSGFTLRTPPPPPPVQQQQQPQQQPQQPAPLSATYDAFLKMTDDQKADVIAQANKTAVPIFLADNATQRVLYGLKLNDKPTLVDDDVLDKMPGRSLYRTVNATNDVQNRIKYSADEIAAQVIKGSVTRVSDSGGSAHGRGIYFADSYTDSASYGRTRGDIKSTAVVRAKLNSNARTITERAASAGATREIASGTKLGKALTIMDSRDRGSVWALAKGYNVVETSVGYYVVLNRTALTASKTIKAKGGSW